MLWRGRESRGSGSGGEGVVRTREGTREKTEGRVTGGGRIHKRDKSWKKGEEGRD